LLSKSIPYAGVTNAFQKASLRWRYKQLLYNQLPSAEVQYKPVLPDFEMLYSQTSSTISQK